MSIKVRTAQGDKTIVPAQGARIRADPPHDAARIAADQPRFAKFRHLF
jgi:hypothetical protein